MCTNRGSYILSFSRIRSINKKENCNINIYIYIQIYVALHIAFTPFSSFARSLALSPSLAYNSKSRYECLVHQRISFSWHRSLSFSPLFALFSILMQSSKKRKRERCRQAPLAGIVDRPRLAKGLDFCSFSPALARFWDGKGGNQRRWLGTSPPTGKSSLPNRVTFSFFFFPPRSLDVRCTQDSPFCPSTIIQTR